MTAVLVGMGGLGTAVYELFSRHQTVTPWDYTWRNGISGRKKPRGPFDLLLVTFPYSQTFVRDVRQYQVIYQPKTTMVFTDVPHGTTKRIEDAVYIPLKGLRDPLL